MDTLDVISKIVIGLFVLKTLIIGSSFNVFLWLKYGKEYYDWYNKTILDAEFKAK